MGAGFSQMNTLTIIQTIQGLLTYVKTQFSSEELSTRGICVGFDARYNSKKYGQLTAQIFARGGVRVRIFNDIVPTPYVAFNVRQYKLCAGVMCTASHNPKEDNGYKVYWSDGAQIIPPHDKGIAAAIDDNLEPWANSWDLPSNLYNDSLIEDPTVETDRDYNQLLSSYCMNKAANEKTKLRFTYTPVHGVGTRAVKAAMKVFSLPDLIEVPLQKDPHPDFPTVKFPNPEEGAGVLELAMEAAEAGGCTHILASDPDADRLAVAEKKNGKWRVFTGNELGALFGWWAVECWKRKGRNNPSTTYMLASTVSSKILDTIAKKEGIKFEDTLTGFKWMGSRSKKLIDQGNHVIFAFEEAIGFMYGSNVLDKDGVSAAAVMAEFIVELDNHGKSLSDQLESIYAEYGFHMTNNSYFICHEKPTIIKMFDRLRKWNGQVNSYPPSLGDYKIAHVRDLTTGYDSREADFNATLPTSASSQMITFYFENGAVLTMRTSGTEPKIKYYTEMIGSSRNDCNEKLNKLVQLMADQFFEPEKNGLISRSS